MFLKKHQKAKGSILPLLNLTMIKTKNVPTENYRRSWYLEELKNLYPAPIVHFEQVIAERNKERKSNSSVPISIDLSASMDKNEDSLKNVGYGTFKQLY